MAVSSWADGAVEETIGSGQDRANIAAFEAAHDGETPTNGTTCKGILVGADSGTSLQYWSGWQSGMNATTYIILTASAANQADGVNDATGNKALIQGRWFMSESTNAFYMDILGIEWVGNSAYNMSVTCDGGGEIRVAKCVIRDGVGDGIKVTGVSAAFTVRIGGSLFKEIATGAYKSAILNEDANCTFEVVNQNSDCFKPKERRKEFIHFLE